MAVTDILERARQAQRDQAHGTTLNIRLDFLQDMIAEIERLQADARPPTAKTLHEVRQHHVKQIGSEEPQ